MKQLNQYIKERLIINKDFNKRNITEVPKDYDELKSIIKERYDKIEFGVLNLNTLTYLHGIHQK